MSRNSNTSIAVAGIDIGKNSFHIIGLDQRGAIVLRQKWSRGQVEARFANIPPCLVAAVSTACSKSSASCISIIYCGRLRGRPSDEAHGYSSKSSRQVSWSTTFSELAPAPISFPHIVVIV